MIIYVYSCDYMLTSTHTLILYKCVCSARTHVFTWQPIYADIIILVLCTYCVINKKIGVANSYHSDGQWNLFLVFLGLLPLLHPSQLSHVGLFVLAEQLEHLFELGLKKPAVGGGCYLPQSCQLCQILLLIIAKRSASKILHALPLWQFAKLFGFTVPVRLRRWPKCPESDLW